MTKILIGLILASVVTNFALANSLWNDAKQTIQDIEETVENTCLSQSDCFIFSYCDLESVPPQCKLQSWFIVIIAGIALSLFSGFLSCICCPCCFIYKCFCQINKMKIFFVNFDLINLDKVLFSYKIFKIKVVSVLVF